MKFKEGQVYKYIGKNDYVFVHGKTYEVFRYAFSGCLVIADEKNRTWEADDLVNLNLANLFKLVKDDEEMELKKGQVYKCTKSAVSWWTEGEIYPVFFDEERNRYVIYDNDGIARTDSKFVPLYTLELVGENKEMNFDERFKLVGNVEDFKPAEEPEEEPEEKELEERQEDINKAVKDMNSYEYLEYLRNQEHYEKNGIQPIDIMKANFTPEEYTGFLKGNVLKYLLRYKHKNGVEDLAKAQVYIGWLLEHYKGESK